MRILALVLILVFSMVGCKGNRGDQGGTGIQGIVGPTGGAGETGSDGQTGGSGLADASGKVCAADQFLVPMQSPEAAANIVFWCAPICEEEKVLTSNWYNGVLSGDNPLFQCRANATSFWKEVIY